MEEICFVGQGSEAAKIRVNESRSAGVIGRRVRTCRRCRRWSWSSVGVRAAKSQTGLGGGGISQVRVRWSVPAGMPVRLSFTRKGVYPYEYTDSWGKSDVPCLPRKEEFYSTLTESGIKEEDFKHAKAVWDHFKCKTLGEYSDLYLKIDYTYLLFSLFVIYQLHMTLISYLLFREFQHKLVFLISFRDSHYQKLL